MRKVIGSGKVGDSIIWDGIKSVICGHYNATYEFPVYMVVGNNTFGGWNRSDFMARHPRLLDAKYSNFKKYTFLSTEELVEFISMFPDKKCSMCSRPLIHSENNSCDFCVVINSL